MYRKVGQPDTTPENFELPFHGQLSPDNPWVVMASLISWSEYEDKYASLFSEERGAPACSFRIALGALIIKLTFRRSKCSISDMLLKSLPDNNYEVCK